MLEKNGVSRLQVSSPNRSLAIREKALGPEHPDARLVRSNLDALSEDRRSVSKLIARAFRWLSNLW
jgi:hypothetical protein